MDAKWTRINNIVLAEFRGSLMLLLVRGKDDKPCLAITNDDDLTFEDYEEVLRENIMGVYDRMVSRFDDSERCSILDDLKECSQDPKYDEHVMNFLLELLPLEPK